MRKGKIIFYMKSGNTVEFLCESFEMTKLSGNDNRELAITGADRAWTIDVTEVEAVLFKKRWWDVF